MDLKHYKLALITGATSPLGQTLAIHLAQYSIRLCLTGRQSGLLKDLQENLSSLTQVEILEIDLLNPHERQHLTTWIEHNVPDLVINNAGMGLYGKALSHSIENQLDILHLNAHALLDISLHAAKALKEHLKGGTIVNISSATDCLIYPTLSVYSASKAFVTSFSQSFDIEMQPYSIRILASCPGSIATNFQKNASKNYFHDAHSHAMSCERATKEILYQIRKDKKVHTFSHTTKILRYLLVHCLPQSLISWILKKMICKRFKQVD
jgi:short-subunit dehydrogenase